jgi:nitroreductase
MDFFDIIKTRRSIRKFEKKPIENEKIDTILEAALRAPSARGGRPWDFVVVTDKDLLTKLSVARPGGAGFLKNAALAIVICADPEKSGPWIEDTTIAALTIQLTAQALGLGSCWSQMRMREHNDQKSAGEYVAELLELPAAFEIECIIGIGYPDETKTAYAKEDLLLERISYNRYGQR